MENFSDGPARETKLFGPTIEYTGVYWHTPPGIPFSPPLFCGLSPLYPFWFFVSDEIRGPWSNGKCFKPNTCSSAVPISLADDFPRIDWFASWSNVVLSSTRTTRSSSASATSKATVCGSHQPGRTSRCPSRGEAESLHGPFAKCF